MTTPEQPGPPPVTGVAPIDEALVALNLGDDVSSHSAHLAAALDVLQQALNNSAEQR